MGYTTEFNGRFDLDRPLTKEQAAYLAQFSETRRMSRDPEVIGKLPDRLREAVGLPLGPQACYYVGSTESFGQDRVGVTDYNDPPEGQPGLWCQWAPTPDSKGIEWNGAEKFYYYVEWLEYLIEHFLEPWGYTLNGVVLWEGEEEDDLGTIRIEDNVVSAEGHAEE